MGRPVASACRCPIPTNITKREILSSASSYARCANNEYARNLRAQAGTVSGFFRVHFPMSARRLARSSIGKTIAGLSGITLSTNLHERTLDDPDFMPFFEHVNAAGVVIFLHPLQRPFPKEWYGYRLEHSSASRLIRRSLARLALGGFFDRYPNIKIIAAHVGGTLPFLAPRIETRLSRGHEPTQAESLFQQTIL